jgi:hypothetical protein
MRLDVLEEFAEAAGLSHWRFELRELPYRTQGKAKPYCSTERRIKYLRNRENELARSRASALKYHHLHKNDPGYRERARANAKAYYYANREAINAKRSRRATHKISPDPKEKP